MRAINFVFALLCVGVGARAEEKAPADSPMAEVRARASSRDVKIPEALVGRLEKEYKRFMSKQEGAAKDEVRRGMLNLNLEFTRVGASNALAENTRVRLPTGGGVVDLADIVSPLRGGFRLRMVAKTEEGGEPVSTRVFFVSRAKERVVGGEAFGDGCHRYMEITNKYHKRWEHEGLNLLTADQRYVSVLGGTFLFVSFVKEALQVGIVSFTDSRYPELLCGDKTP